MSLSENNNERLTNIKTLTHFDSNRNPQFRFEYKKTCSLLPFSSNQQDATFKCGFDNVIGAYVRKSCGLEIDGQINTSQVITELLNDVSFNNDIDKDLFNNIINKFLFNADGQRNIFCLPAFKYTKVSNGKEGKGEIEIGKFLTDIFPLEDSQKELFSDDEDLNFLEKLILSKMWISDSNQIEKRKYKCKLTYIQGLYFKDIKFLLENSKNLIKDLPLFVAYYYFYYCSQLCIVINQGAEADTSTNKKLYYLFDNESLKQSRKAFDMGYKLLKNCSINLLPDITLLAHLNAIMLREDNLLFEIINNYNMQDVDEQKLINDTLEEWIKIVQYRYNLQKENYGSDFIERVKYLSSLYRKIEYPFKDGTGSRFSKALDNIAHSYFTKQHGRNGSCLYMSQDLLLLMLSICKHGNRIKLKEFYHELEIRGIYLDSESKIAIEKRLSNLNLLDKKSDSGDAAYV